MCSRRIQRSTCDGVGSIVRLDEWYTLSGWYDEGVGFNVGVLLGCDGNGVIGFL